MKMNSSNVVGAIVRLCFLITLAVSVQAEVELGAKSLTRADGTVLENITVSAVDPDGVRYATDVGGGKIKFEKLAKSEQEKYGYDPAKAEAFLNAKKAAQAESAAYMASLPAKETAAKKVASSSSSDEKKAAKSRMKQIENQIAGILNKYENRKGNTGPNALYHKDSDGVWKPENPVYGRTDKAFSARDLAVEYRQLEAMLSLPDKS